ncbi:MAG: 60S ribosomal protein L13 [Candidatus Verstraetearchaeota archaeon]|jgi:large subunit ribosomal protein L13e|nr:60S ribosomal protein L13 [Candidatus Verstraetearchaeota archaeon]
MEYTPIVFSPSKKYSPRKKREGRGFSLLELKAAGISEKEAKKLGIRIDKRRRSCHQENVELLKNIKNSSKI